MTEALEWPWTMSLNNELSREEEQGLYLGNQCIITIPTIVLEPRVLFTLTLEAALESPTAGARSNS